MRGTRLLVRPAVALAALLAVASHASAQFGRVTGTVRDAGGKPIKGATVVANNPDAMPASFTAITSDKGQFTMIGLRGGTWRFTATAPGFLASSGNGRVQTIGSNPPLEFRLNKDPGPGGLLAGVSAKELQSALEAADARFEDGAFDEAIAGYRDVLAKAPALTTVNLRIGEALRGKHDYDGAIAHYQHLMADDGLKGRAMLETAATYLEKGDAARAEDTLRTAERAGDGGPDIYYGLAEIHLAANHPDEAARFYQKAAEADPTWAKPLLKLGVLAANRGDRDAATRYLERVVTLSPASDEATQARTILEQVKR